ncbi:hypothetical protein QTV43_000517 [Vibrio vulnificus]|nr:hypothetical protein [Vibrio vulnificus]
MTSYFTLWHNDHHEINRNLELALVAKEMENKLLKEQVGELKLRERHHIKKERILEGTLTSAERKELADDYDRLRKEYFRDIQDFEYGSVELDGVFSSTTTDEYKHLHNDAIQGY